MRKVVLLLLLIIPIVGFTQFFEGKLTYTNSYKSKSTQLKDAQLATMMGSTQDYYIKGADYTSVFNGSKRELVGYARETFQIRLRQACILFILTLKNIQSRKTMG